MCPMMGRPRPRDSERVANARQTGRVERDERLALTMMSSIHDQHLDELFEVSMQFAELDRWSNLQARALRPAGGCADFLEPLLSAIAMSERVLIEFFYGNIRSGHEKPSFDQRDIYANQFVDDWSEAPSERVITHLPILDQHLAHLSRGRTRRWTAAEIVEVGPLADELLTVARKFAKDLPDDGQ